MTYPTTFEMATTDTVSRLLTAPFFRHLLREQVLPASRESGEPLTLLFLDIDSFLGLNQQHGRPCGEEALRGVAEVMRATLPETATLARYSGDEFAAALPETRLDDAFTLAEELRRRVAALSFAGCPGASITCSIGLAAYPANGADDVELVRAADQALWFAKETGRNKVALPLTDSRMVTKTSHYTGTQLERLTQLAKTVKRNEATLLREALDDLLKKYNDQLEAAAST